MPPPTCKVCAENFNKERNRPLLMPCGRSLCHACVLRWLNNPRQRCFVCLGNHDGVRVDNLQVNYDLLEASITSQSDPSPSTREEQSSGMLQLVLQEVDGTKYSIKVFASSTVQEVKNIIQHQHGFSPAKTRLTYAGKVLKDHHKLAFYGVKNGNTLQLITNYHGGRLPQTSL